MFGKRLAIPACLSIAGLLAASSFALAQHGHGGGHGGGGMHMGGGGMHMGGGGMHMAAPAHIGAARGPIAYGAGRAPAAYGAAGRGPITYAARPTMGGANRAYYNGGAGAHHIYVNPGNRGAYTLNRGAYYYAGGYPYGGLGYGLGGFGLGYGLGYGLGGYGLGGYGMGGYGMGGFGLGAYSPLYGYAYNNYGGNPGMTGYYDPSMGGGYGPQQGIAPQGPLPQQPFPQQPQQQPQQPANPPDDIPADAASIRVLLPVADAVILFDGNKTTQTGKERYFHTPSLKEGVNASYKIRATFQQNGKEMVLEQIVPVQPGQNITVDFTRPPTEQLPPPAGK